MTFQKLTIPAFFAALCVIVGCNSASDKSESRTDTTTMQHNEHAKDTVTMNTSDHGLMNTMKTMMDRMRGVQLFGDFDIDYAKLMIEHHQGAVDMAKIVIDKGTDAKMKSMAQNIVTMQTEGVSKLREFISTYKSSGMKHGEGELQKMLTEMQNAMQQMQMSGSTDKDFAAMMISHHEEGIKMSNAQLANGMSDQLKQMAKKSIAADKKDISEFRTWISANK